MKEGKTEKGKTEDDCEGPAFNNKKSRKLADGQKEGGREKEEKERLRRKKKKVGKPISIGKDLTKNQRRLCPMGRIKLGKRESLPRQGKEGKKRWGERK